MKGKPVRYLTLMASLLLILLACNAPAVGVTPLPTPEGSAVLIETSEPTHPPTEITPQPTSGPDVQIQVYFTDENAYGVGAPPFEHAVIRYVPFDADKPEAVLIEFFKGPYEHESEQGLVQITSGFTGLDRLVVEDGIAHVYLMGTCASNGATYTVAQPIMANLLQFDEIRFVKIYDENGETEVPEGESNSIPFCLEP